jgi:predicted DNA-binding WGR domain protein
VKLIRQISLAFRQGSSDKVYDVDLCEVAPGRFVVNFRFGRRGASLQEGSKTALPVSRAEADRIFDRLVAEKKSKGYQESPSGVAVVATGTSSPPPTAEPPGDARDARLLALLQDRREGWTQSLEKLVWRVGELRVPGAAPLLVPHLDAGDSRLSWNLARAWLRLGQLPGAEPDPAVIEAVRSLWSHPKLAPWARSMAGHALRVLLRGEERERFLGEVRELVGDRHLIALEARQFSSLQSALRSEAELLDWMYLSCLDEHRPQLEELMAEVPLAKCFRGVRRVWKVAEASGDAKVFGLFARRFERERANTSYGRKEGFQTGTRRWLRRRSWRTLRRLANAGQAREYVELAAGVLLSVTDADAREPTQKVVGYDYRTRRQITAWTGRYTSLWAFSHILYDHSPRFYADGKSLLFRPHPHLDTRQVPAEREEAYPQAWDQAPEVLASLLDQSRCEEVHLFAVRALRANRQAWGRIPVRRLIGWFSAPYAPTNELAAEVAVTRYDPNDPDTELVLALLSCAVQGPRDIALGWVRANPAVFLSNVSFVVGLVLNDQPSTRLLALDLLGATPLLPSLAQQVLQAVLSAVHRVDPADETATPKLRDAAAVLLAAFSRELAQWPLGEIAELLRHPAAGVAELGAKILLGHQIRPADLPDDLLAAAMTSAHPLVRGIGIRLYGELPDVVLAERFRVLVHLVTSPFADVRMAVAPIVVRLATANRAFAKVLMSALVPILTAEGPEGMHRDVVRLLRTELAPILPVIEPALVFRLLRAEESVVQELGGELLRTNVDPASMTPAQLAILASSDVLGVRRTAMVMLRARVDAVRQDPECVLPLLDARWEDSRQQAFAFVEQHVGFENIPAEVALAVCDSVRPDVQAFGRKLVIHRFEHEDGVRYLLRLAQHPSVPMQEFASSWLEQHAAGNPERMERLLPFFSAVLLRPNKGRVAKVRVLSFLDSQLGQRDTAAVVAKLASELVLTVARSHKAHYVAMLHTIRSKYGDINVPVRVIEPEVRGAV